MTDILQAKMEKLESCLRGLGSVFVAFSSGVDSTFLLKVAHDLLGEKAVAVTAVSSCFPGRELEEAKAFCEREGIEQILMESGELSMEEFLENPENRCYICKKALLSGMQAVAAERGIPYVIEGSNVDDMGDYRPGLAAVAELGVKSPLREAGLGKEEIRVLSREMGLPTFDKPSFACLASRFVYGERITREKLSMVERAEGRLLELGFRQVRVRIHGNLARIELLPEEIPRLWQGNTAAEIERYLRSLGFLYVTLDLGGYRTGSMNRGLTGAPGH